MNNEILYYIGMMFVLISFIFKDINKIRIVNIFSCIAWIILAVFNKSYFVIILNSILIIIHIVHLITMKNAYHVNTDLTDEEIDKIRHDYCNVYNVPYEYIFPNKKS